MIWSRNFTLVYILFLFILVSSLVLGPADFIALDWRVLVLMGILLLIFAAFMAGLFYMIARICLSYLDAKADKSKDSAEALAPDARWRAAFGSFRDFLPGVGSFFVPVAVGYSLQFGFLAALLWWIRPLWQHVWPVAKQVGDALAQGASQEAVLNTLTLTQKADIGQLGLALMAISFIYALFSLLVMLWPVFVVMYEENPLKAYGRSLLQFFREPFRLIAISLLFLGSKLLITFLALQSGLIFEVLGRLFLLMLEIYMSITLFVYAYQAVGRPVLTESTEESENSSSEEPPRL